MVKDFKESYKSESLENILQMAEAKLTLYLNKDNEAYRHYYGSKGENTFNYYY